MPFGWAAAIGGVASLAGAYLSSNAATDAATTQAAATKAAAAQTQDNYGQIRSDLQPFVQSGYNALSNVNARLPDLTTPFNPTQAQLEATPGYQFIKSQGLQAVQNSAAAKGLGISGAALKGAADYATGLADSTYKDQFNIDQANKNNAYTKLLGLVGNGSTAANQTGIFANSANKTAADYLTSGAAATAAGDVGSAKAISNGLTGVGNAYTGYAGVQMVNQQNAQNNLNANAGSLAQANYYNRLAPQGNNGAPAQGYS
jgi:hypothetical protein